MNKKSRVQFPSTLKTDWYDFLKHVSLIYWVRNIKIDVELVLPKHCILSPWDHPIVNKNVRLDSLPKPWFSPQKNKK